MHRYHVPCWTDEDQEDYIRFCEEITFRDGFWKDLEREGLPEGASRLPACPEDFLEPERKPAITTRPVSPDAAFGGALPVFPEVPKLPLAENSAKASGDSCEVGSSKLETPSSSRPHPHAHSQPAPPAGKPRLTLKPHLTSSRTSSRIDHHSNPRREPQSGMMTRQSTESVMARAAQRASDDESTPRRLLRHSRRVRRGNSTRRPSDDGYDDDAARRHLARHSKPMWHENSAENASRMQLQSHNHGSGPNLQGSHVYGNTSLQDHTNAHFGNSYNNCHISNPESRSRGVSTTQLVASAVGGGTIAAITTNLFKTTQVSAQGAERALSISLRERVVQGTVSEVSLSVPEAASIPDVSMTTPSRKTLRTAQNAHVGNCTRPETAGVQSPFLKSSEQAASPRSIGYSVSPIASYCEVKSEIEICKENTSPLKSFLSVPKPYSEQDTTGGDPSTSNTMQRAKITEHCGTGSDYSDGNALQTASARGRKKVVQMLLNKGADVNAQGGEYGNTLQAASAGGHEKVVQILLDKGADVNAQGGKYGNALQAASAGGHEKVAQILLNKGADVNAQGGKYGNALQAASAGGHEKVVQTLLNKGADVNAQRRWYGSALYTASARGHEKVVQILLDKGADVNAQEGWYGSALYTASARGYEKVVQILLDKGADVNAQEGWYGNALQAASAGGHEKVLQILLDKGADVNAEGGL